MRIARRLRDHLRSSTLECLTLAPETLDTARSLRRGAASRPAGRELMPHQEDRIAHRKANAVVSIVLGGTVTVSFAGHATCSMSRWANCIKVWGSDSTSILAS